MQGANDKQDTSLSSKDQLWTPSVGDTPRSSASLHGQPLGAEAQDIRCGAKWFHSLSSEGWAVGLESSIWKCRVLKISGPAQSMVLFPSSADLTYERTWFEGLMRSTSIALVAVGFGPSCLQALLWLKLHTSSTSMAMKEHIVSIGL